MQDLNNIRNAQVKLLYYSSVFSNAYELYL